MQITGSNVNPPSPNWRKNWFKYFQFEEERDSPSDVRNILLIIETLIATVTFQAGVNPPGGVWQDNNNGHQAGTAIYASNSTTYFLFLICNTFALSTSVVMILSLTHRFPLRVEMYVATTGMMITYGSSIFAVTPDDYVPETFVCFVGFLPFLVRGLAYIANLVYHD